MVRSFHDRPLPPGTLERIVELGLHAPSAGFSQGWAFVVLEGRDETGRYAEPDKASTGLGASADEWPVPYWLVDTAMSSMLMLLAAVDAELGALFFGIFDHEEALMAELGVPEGYQPIGTIALGYPADDRPSGSTGRGRRPLDEVVHRGRW